MDSIVIRGLRVDTRVGVSERERARLQTVVIDADIRADLRAAGRSDELDETVDYSSAVSGIAELVSSKESKLLEHLAEAVAEHLGGMQGVRGVSVQIAKEPPPVAEKVDTVGVRIERGET